MLVIMTIFTPIWFVSYFLSSKYINILKEKENTNRIKLFIEKDEQIKGRRIFVNIVSATLITLVIFSVTSFVIFSIYKGLLPTTIVTIILISIFYFILSKFIPSLAYQLFDKNKENLY